MEKKYYTSEKNVQILLALLKAHGIRKIIASPGATNVCFVGSCQSDSWFEMYSSVDERSAAYMACGLAAESGEPVVLSCTGSTASRNYLPGLTEAYYRKLPVLAVTSHQGKDRIGQLFFQNIDRSQLPRDAALCSVELPVVKDKRDFNYCVMEANKAVLELFHNGGGPVHINLFTTYSRDFSIKELPSIRVIKRYMAWDSFPTLPQGKIGIYVGSHSRFSQELTSAIDDFCAEHDAVVICDHTSGYYGRYRLMPTLASMQTYATPPLGTLDLIIHIGEVSAAVFSHSIHGKEVWRVSEDGELRNPFGKLTKVFQTSEPSFFRHYASGNGFSNHDFIDQCNKVCSRPFDNIPELPFCNIWSAMQLSKRLPNGSLLHISASNSRRCWNMFPLPKGVESVSNVGCCGIDGCTSTMIGSSLNNPNRLYYLVTGDLAFFYDINSLGNRHVGNNVRILLVSNGVGAEFKLKEHPVYAFGDEANLFMAAAGHFGNQSHELVKHYVEDLGFRYMKADNKEEYLNQIDEFTDSEIRDRPILFEIFTHHEDEANALEIMRSIDRDAEGFLRRQAINMLSKVGGIDIVKRIIKK